MTADELSAACAKLAECEERAEKAEAKTDGILKRAQTAESRLRDSRAMNQEHIANAKEGWAQYAEAAIARDAATARTEALEKALKEARDEFARIDCQGFNFHFGITSDSDILQKCKEFAARGFASSSDALTALTKEAPNE
jgi:coproporphyrinogen III oxidase-like Fe-S oxidoreductase